MVTKVADNIYKKVVPLPNNPLREIKIFSSIPDSTGRSVRKR